jgi:hypothetical protein
MPQRILQAAQQAQQSLQQIQQVAQELYQASFAGTNAPQVRQDITNETSRGLQTGFPQQTGFSQQPAFSQQSSLSQQTGFSQQSGFPQQSGSFTSSQSFNQPVFAGTEDQESLVQSTSTGTNPQQVRQDIADDISSSQTAKNGMKRKRIEE